VYRTEEELTKLVVPLEGSLGQAVQAIGNGGIGVALVTDGNRRLKGILTDGDFRRAILRGYSLSRTVKDCMNSSPFVLTVVESTRESLIRAFENTSLRHVPIVDSDGRVLDLVVYEDIDRRERENPGARQLKDTEVVIMAGGKGTRLDPFTRILPKPLIPIGDRTLAEVIIDRFVSFGVRHFYISVNYMRKMVKVYFEETRGPYKVDFLEEDKPLGTAGALYQLEGAVRAPFIVTNCDIIVSFDYPEVVRFHHEGGFALTVVGSMMYHTIPYGVCELKAEGLLSRISEKPKYELIVNTGMYVVSPSALKHIPRNEVLDMTSLVDRMVQAGERVGVFPIPEGAWFDVGQWDEYRKTVDKFGSTVRTSAPTTFT
jgi:dTDP-glucose pyrophosphorylase